MLREALLYERLEGGKVHCFLCNHHCRIAEGKTGFCGMRENSAGTLYTHAYGEVVAAHVDPVEKKPLFHMLPGSKTLSIATAGCNFRCGFCQNWQISQLTHASGSAAAGTALEPGQIVTRAKESACDSIAYTYTEPTIFFEYAADTAKIAKKEGLLNIFVTNGYMTPEALEAAAPWLDACNVDLKSFREEFYSKTCQAHLKPVLASIRRMKGLGIWVEITTLVIPGENDSPEELLSIARFIAEIDPDMPWHISRFHPDYQFSETMATPMKTLELAYDIGMSEGLRNVYLGNVMGEYENTMCPQCSTILIRRQGFFLHENRVLAGLCSYCGKTIAGIFTKPVSQ